MDLQQQVRNAEATLRQAQHTSVQHGRPSKDLAAHHAALQRLSNGEAVPYSETLRVVAHEGSRVPRVGSAKTRKPPGYCRNDAGGYYFN